MEKEDIKALQSAMEDMDVPEQKKLVQSEADVHWLGRNLALHNSHHLRMDDARKALKRLGARMVM